MYKVISNNKVIDLVKYPSFVQFLPTGHVAMTNKAYAQGIIGSDGETIYSFTPIVNKDYLLVTIEEISCTEFKRLQSLLNSGYEPSADESALAKAKQDKINSLSISCKNKIVSGFSITLLDGNKYNFKLTTEDQLNLMLIENQLTSGETFFIYHATDQPCQIYSYEDMTKIVKAYKTHVLYHTTYFNVAKQYIKALTDIEKVSRFTYGANVSDSVTDPMLKQILRNGGVQE